MERITKLQKQIANAHMRANREGSFSNPKVSSMEEMKEAMLKGETFNVIYEEIAFRYASMTSLMMASVLDHESKAYTQAVYKGFKNVLNSIDIK
jgi:hypothetical protein